MKTIESMAEASKSEETRRAFSIDMAIAVDQCMNSLSGIRGTVIKQSYKLIKNIRPAYIEHIIYVMTDDFIQAFTPLHENYKAPLPKTAESFPPFENYLSEHEAEASDAFLSVGDKYAATRKTHVIGKAYHTFRPQFKNYFKLAIPYIARVVEKYTIKDAT